MNRTRRGGEGARELKIENRCPTPRETREDAVAGRCREAKLKIALTPARPRRNSRDARTLWRGGVGDWIEYRSDPRDETRETPARPPRREDAVAGRCRGTKSKIGLTTAKIGLTPARPPDETRDIPRHARTLWRGGVGN